MFMAPGPDDLPKPNLGTTRGTKDENMVGGSVGSSIRDFFDLLELSHWRGMKMDGVVEKDGVDAVALSSGRLVPAFDTYCIL